MEFSNGGLPSGHVFSGAYAAKVCTCSIRIQRRLTFAADAPLKTREMQVIPNNKKNYAFTNILMITEMML